MKYSACSEKISRKAFALLLYYLFEFVFILTTFNRELLFFGVDFRYIGLFLEVLLIGARLLKAQFVIRVRKTERLFLAFYLLVLISNLSWGYNGLQALPELVFNLAVLNIYNFLAFVVFWLYREQIDMEHVAKMILISGFILCLSIFWVYNGNTLPAMLSSASRVMSVDTGLGEHHNLFGQGVRVAGFAEDANYATLFCVICIATAIYFVKSKGCKLALCTVYGLGAALSFSRTILLGTAISIVIINIRKFISKTDRVVYSCFVYGTIAASVAAPFLSFDNLLHTVSTRFSFWRNAAHLFLQNPIIGNGIGSFRHYQSSLYHNTWYVQCHNTWWQVLAEHGVFTAIVLSVLLVFLLVDTNDNYKRFLLVLLGVFFCGFEAVYMQIFILVLYLINAAQKR